jgi:hypothetical protein
MLEEAGMTAHVSNSTGHATGSATGLGAVAAFMETQKAAQAKQTELAQNEQVDVAAAVHTADVSGPAEAAESLAAWLSDSFGLAPASAPKLEKPKGAGRYEGSAAIREHANEIDKKLNSLISILVPRLADPNKQVHVADKANEAFTALRRTVSDLERLIGPTSKDLPSSYSVRSHNREGKFAYPEAWADRYWAVCKNTPVETNVEAKAMRYAIEGLHADLGRLQELVVASLLEPGPIAGETHKTGQEYYSKEVGVREVPYFLLWRKFEPITELALRDTFGPRDATAADLLKRVTEYSRHLTAQAKRLDENGMTVHTHVNSKIVEGFLGTKWGAESRLRSL